MHAALRALRRSRQAVDAAALATLAGRSRRRTNPIVARLEELGTLRVVADGTVAPAYAVADPPAAEAVAAQERRRAVERSRVEMVRGYAEAPDCRRAFLLGYFGEPFEPPCGRCDRCRLVDADGATDARRVSRRRRADPLPTGPFAVNDRVRHATFGAGIATGVAPDRLTVAFDDAGYHAIASSAAEQGLLVPEPA